MKNIAKIMLVDDSEEFLFIYSEILKGEGFEVSVSQNASKALEIMDRINPDLLISDLQMPFMNGWEFIRAVKSRQGYRWLPIIVSSSELDGEESSRELGANAYCTKNAAFSTFIRLVKEVLAQSAAQLRIEPEGRHQALRLMAR